MNEETQTVPADTTASLPAGPAESSSPAAEAAAAEAAPRRRRRAGLRDYIESLLVTTILVLFGSSFVVQAFKIPSPSMEGTLLVGDHLLVNKFVYGGRGAWYETLLPYKSVARGDVVVFKFPFDDHTHYVKRVIAVPGDRLRIVDQQVYINGRPLAEPYKVHDASIYDPFGDNFPPASRQFSQRNVRQEWALTLLLHVERGELVLPTGKYFVMGDNRDHSLDSRYWGFVDREAIIGRPILVYWSVNAIAEDYTDRSAGSRMIGLADTVLRLPAKTRWNRVFRVVR